MKSILVPIDFSEYAENALYMAANIAKLKNAEIHLIHTLNIGESVLPESGNKATEVAPFVLLAEEKFESFIDKPYLKNISVKYSVRKSTLYNEINEVIKETKADLIVMGSHGVSGINEILIGSNTQKVVRVSEIPVMVIKDKMTGFSISDVVFACDFQKENIPSYEKAMDFFKLLEVRAHLVYVNTAENFLTTPVIRNVIAEFFRNVDPEFNNTVDAVTIYNHKTVEEGIMSFCEENSAKIIGIPTHGRKGLSHVFSGSIGEDIVNHSDLPVVTFKI